MHAMAAKALGIDVRAFASRTVEHADAKAREFGGRAVAFDQLPAGADIVVVATPPSRHVADALHALAAGAAVLVEKPLATTLADADRLVAADTEGRVAYAENLAHCPAVQAMLSRLGSLGTPTLIEIRMAGPRPTYGQFLTPEWGGGALFDLGAHPIALALLFAGSARVSSVTATLQSGSDHRSDEAATVILSFDTGLRANVIVSWRANLPLWDAQVSGPTGVLRAELLPTASVEHNAIRSLSPAPNSHRRSSRPLATWGNFVRS
jgi:predicted dehydrogenase